MNDDSRRCAATILCVLLSAGFAGEAMAGNDPILYVGVWSGPKIYRYPIAGNGTLGAQLGSPLYAPGDVRDMIVSPGQDYLYYASSDLITYEITNVQGSLSLVATAPIGNGTFADLDQFGDYLYGTHSKNAGRLFVFDVGDGPPTQPIQEAVTPLDPHGVAVSPDGEFVFVANGYDFILDPPETHEISSFPVNPNGTVIDGGAGYSVTASAACPDYFAIADDPTESDDAAFIYHTERPGPDLVVQRSDEGGAVSFEDTEFAGFGAAQLVFDSDTGTVYVANYNSETVSAFVASGATLAKINDYPTGDRPNHLIVHDGFLYVVNAGDIGDPSTISVYEIDGAGGLDLVQTKVIDGVTGNDQGGYRLAVFNPDLIAAAAPPAISLQVSKHAGSPADVDLEWTEGASLYDIYHATNCSDVMDEHLVTTTETDYTHVGAPGNGLSCYNVTTSP